jgi:hypothetical protein
MSILIRGDPVNQLPGKWNSTVFGSKGRKKRHQSPVSHVSEQLLLYTIQLVGLSAQCCCAVRGSSYCDQLCILRIGHLVKFT